MKTEEEWEAENILGMCKFILKAVVMSCFSMATILTGVLWIAGAKDVIKRVDIGVLATGTVYSGVVVVLMIRAKKRLDEILTGKAMVEVHE